MGEAAAGVVGVDNGGEGLLVGLPGGLWLALPTPTLQGCCKSSAHTTWTFLALIQQLFLGSY